MCLLYVIVSYVLYITLLKTILRVWLHASKDKACWKGLTCATKALQITSCYKVCPHGQTNKQEIHKVIHIVHRHYSTQCLLHDKLTLKPDNLGQCGYVNKCVIDDLSYWIHHHYAWLSCSDSLIISKQIPCMTECLSPTLTVLNNLNFIENHKYSPEGNTLTCHETRAVIETYDIVGLLFWACQFKREVLYNYFFLVFFNRCCSTFIAWPTFSYNTNIQYDIKHNHDTEVQFYAGPCTMWPSLWYCHVTTVSIQVCLPDINISHQQTLHHHLVNNTVPDPISIIRTTCMKSVEEVCNSSRQPPSSWNSIIKNISQSSVFLFIYFYLSSLQRLRIDFPASPSLWLLIDTEKTTFS